MKKKIIIIMLGALLCCGGVAQAMNNIDFYSDGVIQDGNNFYNVTLHSSAIVNMTGGIIESIIKTYDNSVINISGGILQHGEIDLYDSSILNLSGGTFEVDNWVTWIYPMDQSIVNVYGSGLTLSPFLSNNTIASGYWANGDDFRLAFGRTNFNSPQIILHEIPEPATISLLLIGIVGMRKLKHQKSYCSKQFI